MIKLIDILNENKLTITQAQLKKLNKRLVDKGYSDYEFGLVNNTPKAYYTFWRREPTREEEEQLNFLQALVHQSTNFDDLYYSIS